MKMVGLYSLISPSVKMTQWSHYYWNGWEAACGVFVKICNYCYVWKTSLWLLRACSSQELHTGSPSLGAGAWGCGVEWVLRGLDVWRKLQQMALHGTREEKHPVSCHFLWGRATGHFKQLVRGSKWTWASSSSLQLSPGWTNSWVKFRWQRSWTLLLVPMVVGGLLFHLTPW